MSLAATLPQLPLPTTVTLDLTGAISSSAPPSPPPTAAVILLSLESSREGAMKKKLRRKRENGGGRKEWWRGKIGVRRERINWHLGGEDRHVVVSINVCHVKSGDLLYAFQIVDIFFTTFCCLYSYILTFFLTLFSLNVCLEMINYTKDCYSLGLSNLLYDPFGFVKTWIHTHPSGFVNTTSSVPQR